MCFYLYSPGKQLELPFIYESITLYPNGFSDIVLDLIVQNITKSKNSSVETISLLYPNTFYDDPKPKDKDFQKVGCFEHRTHELYDTDILANEHYSKKFGRSLERSQGDKNIVIMTERDPHDISKCLSYEARACEKDEIEFRICKSFDFLEQMIIHRLRFTLFIVDFKNIPLMTGEKRWLRLYFRPQRTSLFDLNSLERSAFLRYFRKVQLHYEILGPRNVFKSFLERLNTYPFPDELPLESQVIRHSIQFIRKDIIDEGMKLRETSTSLTDFRLVLRTHNCNIDFVILDKYIFITHPFPMGKENNVYTYSFRAGKRNVLKSLPGRGDNQVDNVDDFILTVSTKTN